MTGLEPAMAYAPFCVTGRYANQLHHTPKLMISYQVGFRIYPQQQLKAHFSVTTGRVAISAYNVGWIVYHQGLQTSDATNDLTLLTSLTVGQPWLFQPYASLSLVHTPPLFSVQYAALSAVHRFFSHCVLTIEPPGGLEPSTG